MKKPFRRRVAVLKSTKSDPQVKRMYVLLKHHADHLAKHPYGASAHLRELIDADMESEK